MQGAEGIDVAKTEVCPISLTMTGCMDCEQRCSSEGNSSARLSTLIRWNASAMRCHQFCAGIRTRFFGVGSGVGLDCIFVHFLASRRKGILPFKSLIKKEFAAACKGLLHSAKVPLDGFLNRRSEVRISPGSLYVLFCDSGDLCSYLARMATCTARAPIHPCPFHFR